MVHLLSKFFNIRPAEWPRVLLIYLILFLIVGSSTWGKTIVEAAFLEQVGVNFLPWVFVFNAALSILAMVIYTPFADRVPNDRLLIAVLVTGILGIGIGLAILAGGLVVVAYPLLYLIYYVVLVSIFNLHWATYVNGFYDTRAAKRIVPVVSSSGRIAGIAAGLTMPLLNTLLAPTGIITVWLATLAAATLPIWLMPRLLGERRPAAGRRDLIAPVTAAPRQKAILSHLDNLRDGYRFVAQSLFLRWMAVSAFISVVLVLLLYFRASQIFVNELQTTQAISNFTGVITGVANLAMIPVLFLLSRIMGWMGLGNTNLIYPFGNLAIAGTVLLGPGIPSAALAYLNRTTFRRTFFAPINTLLFNAVPVRVKGRARAFIDGFVMPLGFLVGGGLLLALPYISDTWFLPALIIIMAAAYAIVSLVIRGQYGRALITMLEQEDFSFLLSQEAADLPLADPATLKQLQKRLNNSPGHEFTVFMAELITQIGGGEAVPILHQAATTCPEARTRAAIISILTAADTRGEPVRRLYTGFLADPDGAVRQAALAGLAQLSGPDSPAFLELAVKLLDDPDIEVKTQILPPLLRSPDPAYQAPAQHILHTLLTAPNVASRVHGIRILHRAFGGQAVAQIAGFLADPADEVRLEAARTIETCTRQKIPPNTAGPVLAAIRPLLQDPVEGVRQAALTAIGRMAAPETFNHLLSTLNDPSPQVRATAVEVMVQIGKAIIPPVRSLLTSPNPQLRKMATVILSRINRREFGPLVTSHISENLLAVYQNHGYLDALEPVKTCPGIPAVQSALREQNRQLINEIFYFLTAIHDPYDVKTVADSLHSDAPRVRANAIEALEALTTPQIARLIAPLVEPDFPTARLLALAADAWDMPRPNTATTLKTLAGHPNHPLLRAIMAVVLANMAAAPAPSGQSQPQNRRQQQRPADLLDRLFDAPHKAPARPDSGSGPLALPEIEALLNTAATDPVEKVREAARVGRRIMAGNNRTRPAKKEGLMLSTVEKVIFLKEVPFFQGMTINQLEVLANVCEEELFEEDRPIFNQGDPGGSLYVVVSGKVGIERAGARKGSIVRLATLGAHAYFGEMTLFDNSPRSASAVALQDTLILRLRREPLITLARQYPDLSLELINVLSQRLREANDQIARLTRTRPRELHKLFDQLE